MGKNINVEDLYVEDIVKGIAKKMNALCLEEQNVTQLSIPEDFGKGFIRANQFASGIGIIEASYYLTTEIEITMEKNKINPLKFVFNLGEKIYHKFEATGEYGTIGKYKGAIIGSSQEDVHTFKIPKNKPIYLFSIELNRNLFEHKLKDFKNTLNDDLKTLLHDIKAVNPFFFSYAFGAETYEKINKIITNEKKGFIGSLFKEGITYTILSETLDRYMGDSKVEKERDLSEKDIDKVLEVSDFIASGLSDLPTIDVIAEDHKISESKLQKIFNCYYNCSVHDFIRNKRLNQARDLLENSSLSVGEIAEKIGVRSNSYLSKIFKERYGVSPSDYRGSRLSKVRLI